MFSCKFKILILSALFLFLQGGFLLAETADLRATDSPFGVLDFLPWDHDWNAYHYTPENVRKAVKLMKEAGVGMVRTDFLWDDIQPKNGIWEFKKYDFITDTLDKSNIKILGLLNYNAAWAGASWNAAPDSDLFILYVKTVVHRYKNRVKYWEFWNEPNQSTYWVPQDGMKAYTELLKQVYEAVKAEDPTAQVLIGGLTGDAAGSLWQVYKKGGKGYFDIVNFHPFQDPLKPESLTLMKAQYTAVYTAMKKNGDEDKPIWLTELGCPGMPANKRTVNWWLGKNPSEHDQAAWVKKVYTEPLRWKGVQKVFWAFFRDTPNQFKSGTDYFGLVREDFTKKLAFKAYQKKALGLTDQRNGSGLER